MSNVYPLTSVRAAEYADADSKREATLRARCALLGAVLNRHRANGVVMFSIGLRKFETISDAEDYMDAVVGDVE